MYDILTWLKFQLFYFHFFFIFLYLLLLVLSFSTTSTNTNKYFPNFIEIIISIDMCSPAILSKP